MDFSFYEDYKVYGDIVISSILIVFFAWRVFSRLPNTINGVGYSADSVGTFDDRLQDYRDRQNGTYRIGR